MKPALITRENYEALKKLNKLCRLIGKKNVGIHAAEALDLCARLKIPVTETHGVPREVMAMFESAIKSNEAKRDRQADFAMREKLAAEALKPDEIEFKHGTFRMSEGYYQIYFAGHPSAFIVNELRVFPYRLKFSTRFEGYVKRHASTDIGLKDRLIKFMESLKESDFIN